MQLNEWCQMTGTTYKQIAQWANADETSAWRWVNNKAKPTPKRIAQIERLTEGAVTYQDWYQFNAQDD